MSKLERILYAEDDPDICAITRLCFVGSGYTVYECKTGNEILQKISTFKPQLIILDVMMPIMDGITTFHKLKSIESSKHIPVIFMTAKVNIQEVEQYYQMGSIGVIYKPFDPNDLINEIENLYNKHLITNGVNKC